MKSGTRDITVVDDSPVLLEVLTGILQDSGFVSQQTCNSCATGAIPFRRIGLYERLHGSQATVD